MTEKMTQLIYDNYPTNPRFPTKAWLQILQAYGTMKPKEYYGYVLDSLEYNTDYDYDDLENWYWEFINDDNETIEDAIFNFVTIALEHDL